MVDSTKKLFEKAKISPENVGFEYKRTNGDHKIYKHPKISGRECLVNFQPDKRDRSKAKKYQVKQLITIIENNNLI